MVSDEAYLQSIYLSRDCLSQWWATKPIYNLSIHLYRDCLSRWWVTKPIYNLSIYLGIVFHDGEPRSLSTIYLSIYLGIVYHNGERRGRRQDPEWSAGEVRGRHHRASRRNWSLNVHRGAIERSRRISLESCEAFKFQYKTCVTIFYSPIVFFYKIFLF